MKNQSKTQKALGQASPHLSHHLLRLLLLILTLGGIGSAWGETFEWDRTGTISYTKTLDVTVTKTSGTASEWTGYDFGTDLTKAVKMEDGTAIKFRVSEGKTATVTIGISTKKNTAIAANYANVKFDDTVTESIISADQTASADAYTFKTIDILNVNAGEHTITRNSKEMGVYYIKVVEEDAAPLSSACEVTNVKRGDTPLVYDEASKIYTLTVPYNDHGDRLEESTPVNDAYGITFEISAGATVTSSDSKGAQLSSPFKVFKSLGTSVGAKNGITLYVTAENGTTNAEYKINLVRGPKPVTKIELNKSVIYIANGISEQLTATVLPDDATDKNVIWTTDDESVATVSNGLVTGKVTWGGKTTITATAADGSGATGSCDVYVYRFSETGTYDRVFNVGATTGNGHPVIYTVFPTEDGNITLDKNDFTLVSSDPDVISAIIYDIQDGNKIRYTLTVGTKSGNATLTLTYVGSNPNYNGKTYTIDYTVNSNASDSNPEIVTSSIDDNSFEGLTVSGTTSGTFGAWTWEKSGGNGPKFPLGDGASTAAEFWHPTAASLKFNLSQTLTELPAGTYKLSFTAKNSYDNQASAGNSGYACLYADVEGSMHATQVNRGDETATYDVIFKVSEGQNVTIGAKTIGTMDARWFWCDEFTLTYYGANSTQAETGDATGAIVGALNNSSAYNSEHSNVYELPAGKTRHISFINHSAKGNPWENWILSAASTNTTAADLMMLRADNWENLDNDATGKANNFNWDTFKEDMDGATVEMDVTNSGKHIYVNATITTAGGTTYKYSAISKDRADEGTAWISFTVEKAHLTSLYIDDAATAYQLSYRLQREGESGDNHTECGSVEIENAQGLALRNGTYVPLNDVIKYSAVANAGYAFKQWGGSGITSTVRDITVNSTTTGEGLVIPTATFAKEYVSTTWTFHEGDGNGTYTENGLDLVVDGGSWPVDQGYTGLKLDGTSATITFTPNAAGTLTVTGTVFKGTSSLLIVTQDGTPLACSETSGGVATYTVAAGQQITIKRNGSEIRLNEIQFTPTEDAQLIAPQISVENGVVTFTNPNAGTTLYYKYDRTKEGVISESNFDGSSTLEVKQIPLSYGVYPANWIQAQVGSGALASAITRYAEEVTVAPPVPVMTKEAATMKFTVPTGCFVEFHIGSESAEAIPVYATSATVELNTSTKKMTIKGTGHSSEDLTYDVTDLYIKTVAEYEIQNSEKSCLGSECIEVTPEVTDISSLSIPETLEIYVGQDLSMTPTYITFSGNNIGNLNKSWVLVSGSDYLTLSSANRTTSTVTGKKSNTSDNATAKLKVIVDGVESNECTVTIKRTPLAVRADHVALSHNGDAPRTLHAIAYNPYTRAVVGSEKVDNEVLKTSNITITAAPKSGSSEFATFENGQIAPTGTATGTETWVITVAPKTTADKDCYVPGTAEIEVTCRDYIYAYNKSVPATTPTARPVTTSDVNDIALNYYAGHNPAECKESENADPLKTWGSNNRRPQEQTISTVTDKPYARIHGWDGINNVAEPTMNSMSEQHTENVSPVYNGNSNGKFTYKPYNYYGDHDEFNVPVMGSFYRFYPEKNGTLIAYLCVNGQFSDSEMAKLGANNDTQTGYASRYTYFLDPYANSMDIQNATVQPTSTVHPGFFNYTLDNCKNTSNLTRDIEALLNNWSAWGNDEKNANGNLVIPVKSTSYAEGKTSYTISDVDWTLFKNLAQDKVGIFQQPIANGDGSFRVITKTYVRCEIPVEKGRVYYVSPTGTKTRMAGVEFIADADDPTSDNVKYYSGKMQGTSSNTEPYVVPAGQNNFINEGNNGKYFNVTLQDRSFKAGQWYSFCLPFDVPQKQIHDIFGEDAVTIHFDNVSKETKVSEETHEEEIVLKMNFWSHFYDQIRAGRPIMIKMPASFPDGSTELAEASVTFQHVKLNAVDPESLYMQNGDWTFKGTYSPVTMGTNAVIVNGTSFYHYKTTKKTLAGNRAWIQGPDITPEAASKLRLVTSMTMFNEEDENEATGIEEILAEMGLHVNSTNNMIYNINGQMVGNDISNLPKGIYIVNGKKLVVK